MGSSINLSRRFSQYFSLVFLKKFKGSSHIYRALLKYGYSNFTLEILEYCEPLVVVEREQYYLDLLKPEYNILKKAGSSLGYKHTEETRAKMSASQSARMFSDEHIARSRKHMIKFNSTPEQKLKAREYMLNLNEKKGITVEVLDLETDSITTYTSIRKAAEALNCAKNALLYLDKEKLDKGINKPL